MTTKRERGGLPPVLVVALCWLASAQSLPAQEAPAPGVAPLLTPPRAPSDPFPDLAELGTRADELAARSDAEVVADLIELARHAVGRARGLREGQKAEAAERAKQIAWAALAAASHRLALHHEERELAAAKRRRQLAEEAATAATHALAHAEAQRQPPAAATAP